MTIKIITLNVLAPGNEDKSLKVVLHPRCLSWIAFQVPGANSDSIEDETQLQLQVLLTFVIRRKYG